LRISVVTICFNCKAEILKTLKSVVGQNFRDYEYIIIDGASTDGTLQIATEYLSSKDVRHQILSEKDAGIYDAMNKGIRLANGDFMIFMNAGDSFATMDSLEKIAPDLNDGNDVVYGDHIVEYPASNFERLVSSKNSDQLWRGMVASHQSTFVRTSILKQNEFDHGERIIGDFKLLHHLWRNNARFKRTNIVLSKVTAGGVSDVRRIESLRRRFEVVRQYDYSSSVLIFYVVQLVSEYLLSTGKLIIPNWLGSYFTRLKYSLGPSKSR
jgi:putative colanic acid biosynthesis glycosyltransferase